MPTAATQDAGWRNEQRLRRKQAVARGTCLQKDHWHIGACCMIKACLLLVMEISKIEFQVSLGV
jgi:hypothetical protein